MTGGNTIEATFGIDITPLKKGFAEAATVAKTGAAKVATEMNRAMTQGSGNWRQFVGQQRSSALSQVGQGLGFRTVSNFRPARPGQYISPAMQMAEQEATAARSILPKGLRGIGILTAAFKLESVYKETVDQIVKIRDANMSAVRLTGGGTAAGSGELNKQLSEIGEVNKMIATRNAIENKKGGPSEGISDIMRFTRKTANWTLGAGNFGEQDAQEAADANERRQKAISIVRQLASQQQELNAIEQEGRMGSEETAELMRADLINRKNILEIAKQQAEAGVDDKSQIDEENRRFQNEKEAIRNRFSLKQAEVESESRLNVLKHDGSTADQQSLAAVKERIRLIDIELSKSVSKERREQLATQRGGLTDQAGDIRLNKFIQSRDNTNMIGDEAEAKRRFKRNKNEFDRAGGLMRPHFDMSGNLIGGTDPVTGEHVNHGEGGGTLEQTYTRHPDAYDVAPKGGMPYKSQLGELGRHMASPGHMAQYAGSEAFQTAFGSPKAPNYSGAVSDAKMWQKDRQAIEKPLTDAGMKAIMEKYWGGE